MSAIDNPQQIVPAGAFAPAAYIPTAAAASAEGGVGGITAADVLRVIKQRKVMIVVTACVLYALIVLATLLIRQFAPAYRNEAFVRYIPPPKEWGGIKGEMMQKDYIAHELATQAQQIASPTVLLEVLALPEIKNTEFYRWYGDDFEKCLYDFEKMLSVTPVRDSFLIRISIAVRNKSEARLIVNKVVERYVSRSRSMLTDEGRNRLEALKNTQAAVSDELQRTRDRIRMLRERRDMPAIEAQRDILIESATVLNNTMAELEATWRLNWPLCAVSIHATCRCRPRCE